MGTALDFCWQAVGGWAYAFRLQHPKRINSSLGSTSSWWHANLCEDTDRKDNHVGCGSVGHHRQRQSKNSGQGRNSTRPATLDFCWQTVGGWAYTFRLQYSKRVNSSFGSPSSWWHESIEDWCNHPKLCYGHHRGLFYVARILGE